MVFPLRLKHLKSAATGAALAGSTKMPSLEASHFCAARISESSTISKQPPDSETALMAPSQLAGRPIRIAVATVSGLSIGAP